MQAGRWQLWIGDKAIALTTIIQFPVTRELRIIGGAGRFYDNWLDDLKQLETYAKEQGCTRVTITGRRGFQRLLKDYTLKRVELEKEL